MKFRWQDFQNYLMQKSIARFAKFFIDDVPVFLLLIINTQYFYDYGIV
jgi:hypothetical protein